MEKHAIIKNVPAKAAILFLLIAIVSLISLSPKWLFPIGAWTGPTALLIFYRYAPFRKKYLWLLSTTIIVQLIAFNQVVPIPGPGLIVFAVLNGLLSTIPYVLDKALSKNYQLFLHTLVFPVAFIAIEFISSSGPWGVWNSMANTQFSFSWLIQIASVSGIWGISFMLYWFSSTIAWLFYLRVNMQLYPKTGLIYPVILAAVLVFGATRYNNTSVNNSNQLKIAGVSVSTIPLLEALYKDVFKKSISLSPELSPVSPELQLANQALIPFIEQPDPIRFRHTLNTLSKIYDSLFLLSKKASEDGVKLIEWSEGSVILWKQNETQFLERAKSFARENKVDLLAPLASIETGELTTGKKFMENKVIYIDKHGNILNTLFKNKPVPGIEPVTPGDGKIPAIKTDAGIVSTSICYDADFPSHMRQLGKIRSGLLLLPSGDWKAISPYHTYAAIIRAIENGCSIVRQVSGGLSVAADYRGKIYGSRDYFSPGDKIFITEIPVVHVDTIYTKIGDTFAYLCVLSTMLLIFYLIVIRIKTKIAIRNARKKYAF